MDDANGILRSSPSPASHNQKTRRSGGRRETDLRRRPGVREQRLTILIATNGESTERAYFTGLKQESDPRG